MARKNESQEKRLNHKFELLLSFKTVWQENSFNRIVDTSLDAARTPSVKIWYTLTHLYGCLKLYCVDFVLQNLYEFV